MTALLLHADDGDIHYGSFLRASLVERASKHNGSRGIPQAIWRATCQLGQPRWPNGRQEAAGESISVTVNSASRTEIVKHATLLGQVNRARPLRVTDPVVDVKLTIFGFHFDETQSASVRKGPCSRRQRRARQRQVVIVERGGKKLGLNNNRLRSLARLWSLARF